MINKLKYWFWGKRALITYVKENDEKFYQSWEEIDELKKIISRREEFIERLMYDNKVYRDAFCRLEDEVKHLRAKWKDYE